ncbi:MAG: M50 family metallopeptidase [Acidobacteriota bacterium]|nr:M50 family metallopeptidase [Acidobacteriota bacterium]
MNEISREPATTEPALPDSLKKQYRITLIGLIVAFFLLWFIIPLFVPGLSRTMFMVTLPFRNLGIFVHEMGHGLFALLSGGNFHWFQMELMQGGVAITSGGLRVFTLLGGLLGPALIGAVLLQTSTRLHNLRWVMIGLGLFFCCGVYYMIKPVFLSAEQYPLLQNWSAGSLIALVIPVGGAAVTFFLMRLGDALQRLYLQMLGILMCYSGYSDTAYIFRFEQLDNGLYSDTRMLASLLGPSPENVPQMLFVIVAGGISVLNFGLMFWGTWRALKH